MAHTISDCPRPMSPAANTPGTLVSQLSLRATLPRSSNSTPSCSSKGDRSGPVKPMANNTRSAGYSRSVPGIFSKLIRPLSKTCSTWWVRKEATRPDPSSVNCSVLMAYSRTPPSSCAEEVR